VWMGAIDRSGLTVSYIQSVYWEFGSGCVLPQTGIVMQNRGVSLSLDPDSVNPLEPGRRPFHTLSPALAVFADGRVLAYGSMGGDGQPQFQAQVFTRIAAGEGLAPAIDAPRFLLGRTWGAVETGLTLEDRFDSNLAADLEKVGHPVVYDRERYGDRFGHAGALMRHLNGRIAAAHDPRSDGGAEGM
jgi:oxamate amidohydrolase